MGLRTNCLVKWLQGGAGGKKKGSRETKRGGEAAREGGGVRWNGRAQDRYGGEGQMGMKNARML